MVSKHKTETMLAFVAETCHANGTQGLKPVLKAAKITVEVPSVWHNINEADETVGQR
jgi:hypothetical protein